MHVVHINCITTYVAKKLLLHTAYFSLRVEGNRYFLVPQ